MAAEGQCGGGVRLPTPPSYMLHARTFDPNTLCLVPEPSATHNPQLRWHLAHEKTPTPLQEDSVEGGSIAPVFSRNRGFRRRLIRNGTGRAELD
jgi:hypothetical protein